MCTLDRRVWLLGLNPGTGVNRLLQTGHSNGTNVKAAATCSKQSEGSYTDLDHARGEQL